MRHLQALLHAASRRVARLSLLTRFTIIGLSVGLLVATGLAWFIEARLTQLMLAEVATRAADQVQLAVQPHVTAADFAPPHRAQTLADLAARLDPVLADERQAGVLRLNIFAPDGTILYSDIVASRGEVEEPEDSPRLAAALAGLVSTDVSSLDSVENADLKAQHDSALEVYVPFVLDGRVVGVYEIYQDLSPLEPIRPLVWGAVLGGIALLLLSLLAVVRGAAVLIRRQQAEAVAQEVRYRVLVEHLPVIAYTAALDDVSSTLYISPQLEAILGFSPEEWTATPDMWARQLHPDDRARVVAELAHRRDRGEPFSSEYRLLARDGRVLWFRDEAARVLDPTRQAPVQQGVMIDITERKGMEEALEHQALHDALTDLPNRTLLGDRLEQALLAAQRDAGSLALVIMDLDRFKDVNDTLGHLRGDELLQEVGRRLRGALRATDTVARLGGDEFAVLLPGVDATVVTPVAEKLLQALEPSFVLEGYSLEIGASLGIALYPQHGQSAADLLRHADVAMYAAKRAGGGLACYDPEQDQHNLDRLTMIGELRKAIEQEQLVLYFQPKLDVGSGRLAGVEALVRWQHPERGLVPPDHFIPLAEQTGLIKPLTHWVLATALRQCRAWREQGREIPVAVNLSMRNLHDPHLPELLAALLDASGVPPACLQLEITESAAMADPDRTLDILSRLRALGVGLSIDDFGTGYSSLSYLKRFPVQELKIDRGFVREIVSSENDLAIVRATIELGHTMGLLVVAEGVEDEGGWQLLASLGCDSAQGYYLGRPLPAAELAHLLGAPLALPLPQLGAVAA